MTEHQSQRHPRLAHYVRRVIHMKQQTALEKLRERRIISNTTGRPSSSMTDEKWQKEFQIQKQFVTPSEPNTRYMKGQHSTDTGDWNEETHGTYHGQTNWQEYCSYINDILRNIRNGETDYCYYLFQILDLLKFHYEDLKTKYCDGYWEVWLDR